jgi:hypothetical protein
VHRGGDDHLHAGRGARILGDRLYWRGIQKNILFAIIFLFAIAISSFGWFTGKNSLRSYLIEKPMNRLLINSSQLLRRFALCATLAALAFTQASRAQTIPNPSFEANAFAAAPGYIGDNADITGWTADNPYGAGLSPTAGDNTFANNGTVPNGTNVAFISGGTTLSTTITGLTAGTVYKLTLRVNATTNEAGLNPILRANVDGTDILTVAIYPVQDVAPYEYIAFEFTATGASAALSLVNDATSDQTLLVDDLTIAVSSGKWSVDAWTDDSTSGIDGQYVYTHAYSFNSSANAVINGVPFTGVPGANPAVSNKLAVTHVASTYTGDANNITGSSATIAKDFIYSGASVASGEYETITVLGLTPGTEYVATIYSCGWDAPTEAWRWATISSGDDRLTINQDHFDNDNGIRFSYRYTAGTNGTAVINIAPINPANVSIHLYAFSNREAVSRNVAPTITSQPVSTTVSGGIPLDLTVGANGFPAPAFQWRFNGTNIAGATSATYSIPQTASQNAGTYDVIVSNSVGSVTSVGARVIVGLPMDNPSFEADSFTQWPGYSGDNNPAHNDLPGGPNMAITGWVQSVLESSGINPISNGESPFADNGTIPNGKQVAFIQTTTGETNTLSQTITGLTVGSQYYVHYYENSRAATPAAILGVTLGSDVVIPDHSVPSGSYHEVFSDVFTATQTSEDLTFSKSSPSAIDTTVLIDNVAIVPVVAGTAPFISVNPASAFAAVGQNAAFSGQVIGSLPLTYQWFRNGTAISGATKATLSLTNLAVAMAGDYTLQASNSAGSVTTVAAHLTVNQPVPGLFNTGVDDAGAPLDDGLIDSHYLLITNPQYEGQQDTVVEDSTVFPISDGTWLRDTDTSKWIGPELNTAADAIGIYTYRTVVDLTGRDPKTVVILGGWATDNTGNDILVNGVSTGNAQSPGFNAYTPFAIYGTNTAFVAGTNTIDFIVENVAAVGYTGLRVEIQQSNVLPAGSNPGGATLAITRNGNALSISWTGTAAGQKLQSAPDINGPWTEVTGTANPYSTTATGNRMFFRVAQ